MHAGVVLLRGMEEMLLVLFEDDKVFLSEYEWESQGDSEMCVRGEIWKEV